MNTLWTLIRRLKTIVETQLSRIVVQLSVALNSNRFRIKIEAKENFHDVDSCQAGDALAPVSRHRLSVRFPSELSRIVQWEIFRFPSPPRRHSITIRGSGRHLVTRALSQNANSLRRVLSSFFISNYSTNYFLEEFFSCRWREKHSFYFF